MHKYTLKTFCRFSCVIFNLLVILSFTGCDNSNTITGTTRIDSLEWRAIAGIQERKVCNESGWEVPEGAIVYNEQEEISSYKIIGYETQYRAEEYQERIGYIPGILRHIYETRTRIVPYQVAIKEPIYATKYYYTIDRWVHLKNVLLAYGYDHNYDYPDYICAENERVYKIEYKYLVHIEANESDECYTSFIIDKAKWESLQVGQEVSFEKDQYGEIHVDWEKYP